MYKISQTNIYIVRKYLIASIIIAIFGGIYEMMSHGVYSLYMIYAFMIPLVIGCLPHIIDKKGIFDIAGELFERMLQASIATLTFGSLMKGVLEIYGTTNKLTAVYDVLGITLLLAAGGVLLINTALKHRIT